MTKTVKCPNCGKKIIWSTESEWRPFCCKRCWLIDLGEWASEAHRIPGKSGDISDDDIMSEMLDP